MKFKGSLQQSRVAMVKLRIRPQELEDILPLTQGCLFTAKFEMQHQKKVSINHNFVEIKAIQITQLCIQTSQPIIVFTQY